MKKIILTLSVLLALTAGLHAAIWLPSVISDNMVLQQSSECTFWGWTDRTSEKITVTGSWNNEPVTVKAYQGLWSVKLKTGKAGGPYTVTIKGHETIVLENVMLGEVWLLSGQSNMHRTPMQELNNKEEEISNAEYPDIRFFNIPIHQSATRQDETPGKWVECTPETFKTFSSVGYFFGREIHKKLDVPVGLINSSWGGTPIKVWIRDSVLRSNGKLYEEVKKIPKTPWWPDKPGAAYNTMIYPLINFNIAGALWYQGESDRQAPYTYYETLPLLINSWRKDWGKEFPFYFVQIAPFKYKDTTNIQAAIVRDAQLQTMLNVPNTGMAVINDIGELKNIHPANKQDVGKRLALWALAKTYGVKDIVFSGPVYKSMEVKKNRIILHFDYVDGGLVCKGKELKEFYIAGADRKFYPAKAKIKGETVEVWSKDVKEPVAVRFAFSNTAQPNLFNKAGLPASAFKTDNLK